MRTSVLKSAIIAILMAVCAPALADIDTNMSRAHLTAISGQQGDTTEDAHSDAIEIVYLRERGDKPCKLSVAFGDDDIEADQCFGGSHQVNDAFRIDIPRDRLVTGIQPCYNRRSGRLKGMRVFYDDEPEGGVVSEIFPNCRGNRGRWGDRINCPDAYRGFGIRAHFTELPGNRANPIVGVQLICGRVS